MYPVSRTTHIVHINPVGISPAVLKALLQTARQGLRDVMEADKLLDALDLLLELVRSLVHPQHDARNVTEDGGAEQSWREEETGGVSCRRWRER